MNCETTYEQEKHIRKLLYKNLSNSTYVLYGVQAAINKKRKYFLLPDQQLANHLILAFYFYERKTNG